MFSGCSIEEHSWLWPTSENHKQRAPPLQQRPGKRRRIEVEVERGCREQLLTRATFGWFLYSKIWWQATTSGRPQGRLRRPNLKDFPTKKFEDFCWPSSSTTKIPTLPSKQIKAKLHIEFNLSSLRFIIVYIFNWKTEIMVRKWNSDENDTQ